MKNFREIQSSIAGDRSYILEQLCRNAILQVPIKINPLIRDV